ncbi:MAG: glycosyltransferase family 39 protein [Burkholderiales bacterium]|nr:MAG: glycosyltransferase family 39 protein [Burkholderiales bacterium]
MSRPPAPIAAPGPRALVALLAALTAYRLAMIALAPYTLSVDEAQYWTWSRELAAGYYSKPPVIAWGIAATTALLGDSEFGVRALSALLYLASALAVGALARELGARDAAGWAALGFLSMPGISHYARAMTVDAWLLLFWSLALLGLVRALRTDGWRDWLLTGVAAGLGLMSKYTMGAFGLLAAAWLVAAPERRARLRSPRPWVAALVALAVFAPNVLWNVEYGFPTLRHTAEISGLERVALRPAQALGFVAGQWIYMGPLLGLLGFVAWFHALRRGRLDGEAVDPRAQALLWFSLPLIGLVAIMGLFGRALANWAAPATIAWSLLTVAWLVRSGRPGLLGTAVVLNLLLLAPIHHFDPIARALGIELSANTDPYKRVRGWDAFGAEVAGILARYPDAMLLVDTRELAAQAAFYASVPPRRIRVWNPGARIDNHYALVASLRDPDDRAYLYLGRCIDPEQLRASFAGYRRLDEIRVPVHDDYAIRTHAAVLEGFAGIAARADGAARTGGRDERSDAAAAGGGEPGRAGSERAPPDAACLFR